MFFLSLFVTSHNVPHERRWRSGSSRWLYQQPSPSLGAGPSSPSRAVATTPAGTVLVVGATGSTSATSVRGHEACLLPCHGPCSANNQSSSCKGYGATNGQLRHHRHSPTTAESSHHREAQLMLARKPLRVY